MIEHRIEYGLDRFNLGWWECSCAAGGEGLGNDEDARDAALAHVAEYTA